MSLQLRSGVEPIILTCRGALEVKGEDIFEGEVTSYGQRRPFAPRKSSIVNTCQCCLDVEVLSPIWEQSKVGTALPSLLDFLFPGCGRTQVAGDFSDGKSISTPELTAEVTFAMLKASLATWCSGRSVLSPLESP